MSAPLRLVPQRGAARLSQQTGDAAEALVARVCAAPPMRAVAELTRRYTPKKQLPNGSVVYLAAQGPDFVGWLRGAPHVHVECEVKWVRTSRLDFARFNAEQRRLLTAADADGHAALVLVLLGPALAVATWHLLPWSLVAATEAGGAKSLRATELAGWRVRDAARWLDPDRVARWVGR